MSNQTKPNRRIETLQQEGVDINSIPFERWGVAVHVLHRLACQANVNFTEADEGIYVLSCIGNAAPSGSATREFYHNTAQELAHNFAGYIESCWMGSDSGLKFNAAHWQTLRYESDTSGAFSIIQISQGVSYMMHLLRVHLVKQEDDWEEAVSSIGQQAHEALELIRGRVLDISFDTLIEEDDDLGSIKAYHIEAQKCLGAMSHMLKEVLASFPWGEGAEDLGDDSDTLKVEAILE